MVTATLFLPAELWLHVLRQHTDPLHLWTSCRQVSKEWRDEVNKIFAARYLQDHRMTELVFHLRRPTSSVTMHFDHFDAILPDVPLPKVPRQSPSPLKLDDIERDPFIPLEPQHPPQDVWLQRCEMLKQMRISEWKHNLRAYHEKNFEELQEGGGLNSPTHTIRVKRLVNDTELPGLRVDYDKREVSFRWLDMFECLYREEAALVKSVTRFVKEHPPVVVPVYRLRDVYQNKAAKYKLIEYYEDARKQLRRRRIVLWYKERVDWNMPEISPASEESAVTRIDEVEKKLEFVTFAEDANDVRAAREAEMPWMPCSRRGCPEK